MAELFLELFSEEIPSGMQARAADDLGSLLTKALDGLNPRDLRTFFGARRIAAVLNIDAEIPARSVSERGPREGAPEKALEGFTRKHGVTPADLTLENGFWVLNKSLDPVSAESRVSEAVPDLLWKFPWPKSMRWGAGSNFTWVRPLRRITCLLDGHVVPFALARDGDDAHGLKASNLSEGHRFLAPGAFEVLSGQQWQDELETRSVIVDMDSRRDMVRTGVARLAEQHDITVVQDDGLVDEVCGLVEYPVPLLGQIDAAFMDLPAEVMQVSMRINQRYFALRNPDGSAAPYFAFIGNLPFKDGGKLTTAGNERVLRARFADARHFWDLDRKTKLADRVPALAAVTFHAKLGTQAERAERISKLAGTVAQAMGLDGAQIAQAERAGLLAKADLTTGMVGEFPELQGVMGGYYAAHAGENEAVSRAVAEHYLPRGQSDETAKAPVSVAVTLADRLDLLAGFFAIGELPSGSGDPYALRRAALGIIRTIRDNGLRLDLTALFAQAANGRTGGELAKLPDFMAERLRVQLRSEGERHDVLAAILTRGLDGDLVRLLARTSALSEMIQTEDGRNLLAAAKRAANILRIEDKKDGPHTGAPDPLLYTQDEERALAAGLDQAVPTIETALKEERFTDAMQAIAALRPTLDRFFEAVTVNAPEPKVRANRLKLLSLFRETTALIADFGQIEG
ncbi:glycine--tRNA ligase subunit beta [Gluconobacter sphaericus]|uniref:Glycine--tRNA ligase beta subunit n=1 Tax=Gluconobacter sphaericus NBRC 12467 TaxID=1307951 RepID=A0AA37WAZ7_9PROT|nr:glycine--tRNA ligase subunit beta [Gluconobacter sphaericus]MBF0884554.1 glycine--tRNA ligase subunit beta [Gluconobacter sphaericus]GBR53480.1 glycyl-tRNA synthetase subunit beta [Gluconobacter sphaericus NBRC 12467]GEB41431.1 glycine--tRNA ligase beta subunit [Gluconobacter sphaericus NBRC 12467]GLQ83541.1 glycine--tRNA ligase beta subunit [Gluconobacter sphaericus NBRC 12467]